MEHRSPAFITFAFRTQRGPSMDTTTTKCLNGKPSMPFTFKLVLFQHPPYTSFVPRLLPAFQCCMQKNGRSWEAKSCECNCAITLYRKDRTIPEPLKTVWREVRAYLCSPGQYTTTLKRQILCEIYLCELCESSAGCINLSCINFYHAIRYDA